MVLLMFWNELWLKKRYTKANQKSISKHSSQFSQIKLICPLTKSVILNNNHGFRIWKWSRFNELSSKWTRVQIIKWEESELDKTKLRGSVKVRGMRMEWNKRLEPKEKNQPLYVTLTLTALYLNEIINSRANKDDRWYIYINRVECMNVRVLA